MDQHQPDKTVTSSSDGRDSRTSGDSEVQQGENIEQQHHQSSTNEEQEEYIEQANNNTEQANSSPDKSGSNN